MRTELCGTPVGLIVRPALTVRGIPPRPNRQEDRKRDCVLKLVCTAQGRAASRRTLHTRKSVLYIIHELASS